MHLNSFSKGYILFILIIYKINYPYIIKLHFKNFAYLMGSVKFYFQGYNI